MTKWRPLGFVLIFMEATWNHPNSPKGICPRLKCSGCCAHDGAQYMPIRGVSSRGRGCRSRLRRRRVQVRRLLFRLQRLVRHPADLLQGPLPAAIRMGALIIRRVDDERRTNSRDPPHRHYAGGHPQTPHLTNDVKPYNATSNGIQKGAWDPLPGRGRG